MHLRPLIAFFVLSAALLTGLTSGAQPLSIPSLHAEESGSGSDAVADDISIKDKALFDKAVETGRTEDWMAVLNFRGQKKAGR